jgi:hypothetical protein
MKLVPHVLPAAFGLLLTLGVLASPTEEPKIHECRDANGNVVYQDDPCPETPRRKVAAPVPSKPPAATADPHAPAAVPSSPAAGRAVRPWEWTVIEPARGGRPPIAARSAIQPPTGRFASPEQTWRAFVAAIGSGDRTAAAACLTSSALARLGADAETFPIEKLRETVNTFTRIEIDGEVGPFWSIHASRPNMPPRWIFFERNGRGEWKIAAI